MPVQIEVNVHIHSAPPDMLARIEQGVTQVLAITQQVLAEVGKDPAEVERIINMLGDQRAKLQAATAASGT